MCPAVPEDYITYFREKGVTAVVRLNKKMYESARWGDDNKSVHLFWFVPYPNIYISGCTPASTLAPTPNLHAHQRRNNPPRRRFTQHGVRHYELYFPDGTCPSEPIMYRFLDTVEREPGALAVGGGLLWGDVLWVGVHVVLRVVCVLVGDRGLVVAGLWVVLVGMYNWVCRNR